MELPWVKHQKLLTLDTTMNDNERNVIFSTWSIDVFLLNVKKK